MKQLGANLAIPMGAPGQGPPPKKIETGASGPGVKSMGLNIPMGMPGQGPPPKKIETGASGPGVKNMGLNIPMGAPPAGGGVKSMGLNIPMGMPGQAPPKRELSQEEVDKRASHLKHNRRPTINSSIVRDARSFDALDENVENYVCLCYFMLCMTWSLAVSPHHHPNSIEKQVCATVSNMILPIETFRTHFPYFDSPSKFISPHIPTDHIHPFQLLTFS